MTYKKTWFSCLLWAVFTCITGVMLANYTILFWKKEIGAAVSYGTIVCVFFAFALVIGCYFLIRKVLLPIGMKCRMNEHTVLLLEIFAVLCIFFVGLLYRIYLCVHSSTEMITVTEYYHLATVKAGETVQPLVHGASYLYTLCLSFVLSFLGNKVMAGVWLQVVVQMITILLAYFTTRGMAGKIPAFVTMIVLAVSSVYTSQIFSLTPESLFFALYLAGFLIVSSYVKDYCNNQFGKTAVISGALLAGIVIGVLTYLDAVSVTLFVLLAGLMTGTRKIEEDEYFPSMGFSIFMFGLSIVTGGFVLFGMFALDAYANGEAVIQIAETWADLYLAHLPMNYILYQSGRSVIECAVLVTLASLLIMAFWNHRKVQNASPWICLMLLLSPTPLASSGVLDYMVYSVFLWSVMAGIGLQQSFVPAEEMKEKPNITEKETEEVEVITNEKPKSRFLENPLPLPKKHEKRELDYQYTIDEAQMEFDIDIKENDDFDI